ncbi:MAG: hypothetical protein R3C68_01890 [Myxococcota bacterium]
MRINFMISSDGGFATDGIEDGSLRMIATGLPLPPGPAPKTNDLVIVSGRCASGALTTDILRLAADDSGPASGYQRTYPSVTQIDTVACNLTDYTSDPGVFNFNFGRAVMADFFIDRVTDPDHPALRLRLDPAQPLTDALYVAYDIDDP